MAMPSPSYTTTFRVNAGTSPRATAEVISAVAEAGATVMGVDVVHSGGDGITVDITADTVDGKHVTAVRESIDALEGVSVAKVSDSTFLLHLGGKIGVTSKVPLRTRRDLSRAYTPGVARVCLAIAENKDDARRLTIKRNTVAVVTDGTAVLGLGDIGPEASMPVMEGKAALFKEFGDVDAWPVALDTK
ncbi:MAG: NAD-dependent malic enzyme, partial [Actinomycetaceae bacterium]